MKNRNSSHITLFAILMMLVTSFILVTGDSQAEDYSNNIGFMKNPPKELKEKFPMCDQFLDVKWIRQFPDGNWGHDWVGTVVAEMYTTDQKILKELLVTEWHNRDAIKVNIYDVTRSEHSVDSLKKLLLSADKIFIKSHELEVSKDRELIKAATKSIFIAKPSKDGLLSNSFTSSTQNICIALPKEQGTWVIEKVRPFLSESRMSEADRKKFEQLKTLIDNDCEKVIGEKKCEKSSYSWSWLNVNLFVADDADGDGVIDYRSSRMIAFLNNSNPFLMRMFNCNPYSATDYYEPYARQRGQHYVAEEKRKYLLNKKNNN